METIPSADELSPCAGRPFFARDTTRTQYPTSRNLDGHIPGNLNHRSAWTNTTPLVKPHGTKKGTTRDPRLRDLHLFVPIGIAGRGRSEAHRLSRSTPSNLTAIALDNGYLEDKKTVGEHESGPSPILSRDPLAHGWRRRLCSRARALPILGVYHRWDGRWRQQAHQKLSCPQTVKLAIIDLKRQAAAECLVRHGMTVLA